MTASGDALVAIYGSTARGDADASSDLDVLIVADPDLEIARSIVPLGAHQSQYSWSEWYEMRREGSIFLRHIAAESCVIWHTGDGLQRFDASISELPKYQNARRDIDSFASALDAVRNELTREDCCIYFELSVLAMVVRHISILLCYLIGNVNFSRVESIRIATKATGAATSLADDFNELYEFRLAAQRGHAFPKALPSNVKVCRWIEQAYELLQIAKELTADERSSI